MFVQSLSINTHSNKIPFKNQNIPQKTPETTADDRYPADAKVSEAIKAQVLFPNEIEHSRKLALDALKLKYNSSKILKQAKEFLEDAQKNYNEAMAIGRMGQSQRFEKIYDNGLLKASFDFELDNENNCLVDGFLRIKEYDASGNITRSTITEDSTKSWTVHQATSEYDKEDTFKVFNCRVSDVYKGARPNESGLYDIDFVICKDEEGIIVFKDVKNAKDIFSFNKCRAMSVGQYFKFDTEGNLVDFASGLSGSGSKMTADSYYSYSKNNQILIIENCNRPDEISYEFTDKASNCKIYRRTDKN